MYLILVSVLLATVSAKCTHPPDTWCDSNYPQIAEDCGVTKQCAAYERNVLNKPVTVTLLYEAFCPYCQRTIEELSKIAPRLKDFTKKGLLRLELIPYGNVNRTNTSGKISYHCQHGPPECLMNRMELCSLSVMHKHEPKGFFNYAELIFCMENYLQQNPTMGKKALHHCLLDLPDIPDRAKLENEIKSCVKNNSNALMEQAYQTTSSISPQKLLLVPWFVVGGTSTNVTAAQGLRVQKDPQTIIAAVCSAYRGKNHNKMCSLF